MAEWIKSYLYKRQQFVKLGDVCSPYMDITCGVPQGSVLGPKLFILYINDMCKLSRTLKMVVFADDTNIFCCGKRLQELIDHATSELCMLKRWFDRNKLSLNLTKTKFMIFSNAKTHSQIRLMVDGVEIERVYENKFLGVIIDEKINWKAHIKHVSTKLSKSIAVLNKAKHILNFDSLRMLYCSLVLPYLDYCCEVWGNTYKSTLNRVIILQKRAIRIIFNTTYWEHTNKLFCNSNLLKLRDIVDYKTAIIMYKARYKQLPRNIQTMFRDREGGYGLRGELNFKTIRTRTTMKSFCISSCGVKIWNSIEVEIKQSPNIHTFKKRYKKYIMMRYVEEELGS